jgi:HD-like signal output (HDOD) protein
MWRKGDAYMVLWYIHTTTKQQQQVTTTYGIVLLHNLGELTIEAQLATIAGLLQLV